MPPSNGPRDAVVPPLPPGTVIRHDGLALIEVEDAADLATLLADPHLAGSIVARIGEREAVVLPQAVARLLLAMAKAGHTPTVVDAP